ncbi:MAG TPA: malto-oligosyltrehalose synthase [Clostridia bacterium]|nr:malto-oligosyltrehalose synthase [Clostridia bacterium]
MRNQSAPLLDESSGISECLDRLASRKDDTRPLSTYRLQFNRNFRFEDARALVPYLAKLGVSTCYSSPLLEARSGSMHGYDITNHNKLNSEIGSEEEFRDLVSALKAHGLDLLLDVVPNHMGVGYDSNPWWLDVLQNGRSSKFAHFFDIDWTPLKPELRDKILLPILGNQYGEELESGRLPVTFDEGRFVVQYYDKPLPIDPRTIPLIFAPMGDINPRDYAGFEGVVNELRTLLVAFSELPPHSTGEVDRAMRQREMPYLLQRLRELAERSPEIRAIVDRALQRLNGTPGDPRSFDALHRLLEEQAYRLAHWRVSAEEINYRRFFDVNDLVGLRMEDPQVFAATQELIRRLLADGSVMGLRIDHPDGLFNPPQYFTRMQMLYAASQCCGPIPKPPLAENGIEVDVQTVFGKHNWAQNQPPLYVIVEKILEPGEELPPEWSVDGTVGYDFANLVNGIFIDTQNRRAFSNLYQRFVGDTVDVDTLIYESKKLIMNSALSSEVNVLGHMLDEISSLDRRARDFTRKTLRDAISETIACFPVYRTYIDERGNITDRDRGYIDEAIARAKRRNGTMAFQVFDFLRDILLLRGGDSGAPIYGYRKQLYFSLKFQQLTGPVMAKGLEDTACYVYNRFVSVNEVGGSPKQFGVELDHFHRRNQLRAENWPHSMLTTSTHDMKRSEDVRMRLDVLSEMPRLWSAQVLRWRRSNRSRKRALSDGRIVPDANEEYLLYQTLIGAWPLRSQAASSESGQGDSLQSESVEVRDLRASGESSTAPESLPLSPEQREQFVKRIQGYMTKAVHEAKVNLSWVNQNPEYVELLQKFIARILRTGTEAKPNTFLEQIEHFVPRVALFGAINSLSQVLIKLTAPGVPDIYQGQELWDFSLVDPDNRRPVDFDLRRQYLDELSQRAASGDLIAICDELIRSWQDGRIKLWVTNRTLQFRREHGQLFQQGDYVPLHGAVQNRNHVVSFARVHERDMVIAATPRFAYTLLHGEQRVPLGDVWGDAELELPPNANNAQFTNLFTGELLRASREHTLLCRDIFRHFPVALLISNGK